MSAATVQNAQQRPDLANRRLIAVSLMMIGLLCVYFVLLPYLPEIMHQPGGPIVYLFGVAGTLLLLVAAAFVFVKRTGRGGSPVSWFIAHIVCGNIGLVLVAVHTTGKFDRPPALLLLSLLALMALGIWARVLASRTMADTFGTKLAGFAAPDAERLARLRAIIDQKVELLARLDPGAQEATFSVTLSHLVRRPVDAVAYLRLVRLEQRMMGTRSSVGPAQAWWRPIHLLLATAFIIGLLIHIVMVTFFAGYVADGGPVTWWHITAWDIW